MKKSTVIGVILVAIVVAAAVALMLTSNNKQTASTANIEDNSSTTHEEGSSKSANNEAATKAEAVSTTSVNISNYSYEPASIKVKVGQTVTWTNQDAVQHDVVADSESADAPKSELLSKGESYSFTFKKAGTYNYHCSPHPYMKGTVVVEE
jgi:amicyanin